jgi:hypothetical protein
MPLSANPAARTALMYITTGALVDIWAGVWWYYMHNQGAGDIDRTWWYVDIGLLLSGAILIIIGLTIGRIGHEARHADAPPPSPNAGTSPTQPTMQGNVPVVNNPQAVFPNGVPMVPTTGVTAAGVPVAGVPTAAGVVQPAPGTKPHHT